MQLILSSHSEIPTELISLTTLSNHRNKFLKNAHDSQYFSYINYVYNRVTKQTTALIRLPMSKRCTFT